MSSRASRIGVIAFSCISLQSSFMDSQTTNRYFYDDLSQLTKVVDSTGIVIEYVYDPVGNILQVKRSILTNPNGLQLFNVTPARTGVGATILIQGQGFSTNPAEDVVTINGLAATVLSATSTALVVSVPLSAMSGVVSISVNGNTAQWDNNITIVQSPFIASIRPHSAVLNSTVTVSIVGANLIGASFSFNNPFLPATVSSISTDGTAATISVVAGVIGHYGLVATNAAGSSSAIISPSNTFCILSGSPNQDTDNDGLSDAQEIALRTDGCNADSDGDGFPDGVEVASGSDPLDPNSTPFTGRIPGSTWAVMGSVLNTSNGITGEGATEIDASLS